MATMPKPLSAALAALALGVSAPALAKDYDPILMDAGEQIDGQSMVVHLVMEQEEIATEVDIGRVASSASGGILDTLIIAGIDRDRKRKQEAQAKERAEAMVIGLRDSLAEFDVPALAWAATETAFGGSTFCEAGNPEACDNTAAPRGTISYSYGLSPDFTQIRVAAEFAYLPAGKSEDAFRQSVTSVVELQKRSYEKEDNADQWAANDGALAKAALEKGFERIGKMIPELVAIDKKAFKSLTNKKRPKSFAAGFYGPVLFNDDLGPVIWTDAAAIAVQ